MCVHAIRDPCRLFIRVGCSSVSVVHLCWLFNRRLFICVGCSTACQIWAMQFGLALFIPAALRPHLCPHLSNDGKRGVRTYVRMLVRVCVCVCVYVIVSYYTKVLI